MSYDGHRAERILPPWGYGTSANSTVRHYNTSTTSATDEIPAHWRGRYVMIQAGTEDCWVLFGPTSAIDVGYDLTDSVSSFLGWRLVADTPYHFLLPRNCTHIAHEAGGSGTLQLALTNYEGEAANP